MQSIKCLLSVGCQFESKQNNSEWWNNKRKHCSNQNHFQSIKMNWMVIARNWKTYSQFMDKDTETHICGYVRERAHLMINWQRNFDLTVWWQCITTNMLYSKRINYRKRGKSNGKHGKRHKTIRREKKKIGEPAPTRRNWVTEKRLWNRKTNKIQKKNKTGTVWSRTN